MTIDFEKLLAREFPLVEQQYTRKDTILYALGVGLGADPSDARQLAFVYEQGLPDLPFLALPFMASVLAGPGFWVREPDTGVDWVRVLHGEQELDFHHPLPTEGAIRSRARVTGIVDKGAGKGALILTERDGIHAESGKTLFTVRQTIFARGDGGFGAPKAPNIPEGGDGSRAPSAAGGRPHRTPETPPESTCDLPTLPQAALIYRLSGDPNPLHVDPEVAAQAGYPRPILHGLCTLGVAGHALLKTCCGYDPARFKTLRVRFTAPVFPGETLRTEMWRQGGESGAASGDVVSFRTRVVERDVVVLEHGRAEILPEA